MTKLFDEIEMLLRRMIHEEIVDLIGHAGKQDVGRERKANQSEELAQALLKANDVAEMLSVNVQQVYELARQSQVNGFPVIKLGERQYRFDRNAVEQ